MAKQIGKSIKIDATPAVVFDVTQDYNRRLEWDTFLKKAELIDAREAEVGVKVWCVSKYGVGMETRYVSFNRPKVTAVEMSDSSMLFKNFAGSWQFIPQDEKSTRVIFTYSYKLKLFSKPAAPIIKWILERDVKKRLHDLKIFIES